MKNEPVTRRSFVTLSAVAGAAFVLGFRADDARGATPGAIGLVDPETGRVRDADWTPNLYLSIDAQGVVRIMSHKSEMGQGVWTALPMIVAEELDADWSKVRVERAPTNGKYQTSTGGSTSVRTSWTPLRNAGATARAMLVAAAARQWGVPASECRTEAGVVSHASGKRATYGELAAAAAQVPVPAASEVRLKSPADYRIIGKATPRLDLPAKVNGEMKFGIDTRVPGMLYASVARCPVIGGSIRSVNDSKARAVAGVRNVVKLDAVPALLPARVAVLADDTWSAMKGRDALQVDWDPGPNAGYSTDEAWKAYRAKVNSTDAVVTSSAGTVRAAGPGERTVEAVYEYPLLAHATMEPMNCTADVRADGVEIWAPTQAPDRIRTAVAELLGIAPDKVTVHVTMLGGGFGRRSKEDFAIDAVQISKAAGRPVKVTWTREEDIQHDFFRVDGLQRLRAVLDAQGNVVSWEDRVVGPSTEAYGNPNSNPQRRYDAARRPPYNFANQKLEFVYVPSPVPLWFWRAVANTQDGYCMEAFMDEVAQAAGKDPVQFRLAALEGQPRMQEVVRLAAEKSGWGTPLPAGQGRGIAFYDYDGTFVAQVVELEVPANGRVKVNRVTCAFDCGQLINPDTVKAQVESAIGWALSAALYGEITVKNGEVEQSNFDTYQVARINEMPRVDVHLVENHETPTGVGEPGVPPFIPAMLNAIHAATGVRLRRTPITPQALSAAMKHPVTENQGVR